MYPANIAPLINGRIATKNNSGKRASTDLIILHTMEVPEKTERAKWASEYFTTSNNSINFNVSDKETWGSADIDEVAWHCGVFSVNQRSVGIETTMSHGTPVTDFQRAMMARLAKLVAELCRYYNIPAVWLTPAEVKAGKKGICSHNDVTLAYGVNGGHIDNPCKLWGQGNFIALVKAELTGTTPTPNGTTKAGQFKVRIKGAGTLNVRSGAGYDYPVVMTVKDGEAFTITETKDGWGKLLSGAGWISMYYTERLTASGNKFRVVVTADVLNVRAEPNTSSDVVTTVKSGEVFTITATESNWGKLLSVAGWIHLGYTERV